MGAEDIARAARRRNAVAQRTLAVRRAQQRRFRIGLACAAVLHAALFVGVGTWSSPRQLGDAGREPGRHRRGAGRRGRPEEPQHGADAADQHRERGAAPATATAAAATAATAAATPPAEAEPPPPPVPAPA